jgi:hypothetical protein
MWSSFKYVSSTYTQDSFLKLGNSVLIFKTRMATLENPLKNSYKLTFQWFRPVITPLPLLPFLLKVYLPIKAMSSWQEPLIRDKGCATLEFPLLVQSRLPRPWPESGVTPSNDPRMAHASSQVHTKIYIRGGEDSVLIKFSESDNRGVRRKRLRHCLPIQPSGRFRCPLKVIKTKNKWLVNSKKMY